jgi:predicted CXXCH cytochrome family protein
MALPRPRLLWSIVLAMTSCHADLLTRRCDPFRTPHTAGPPVTKAEERSSHAPYSAGDCAACHNAWTAAPGESLEQAVQRAGIIVPVNENCASCHQELFRAPPPGHPPAQAYCTSCHAPHNSRLRSLLRDEDVTRACLDYPPPYPDKPVVLARRKIAGKGP